MQKILIITDAWKPQVNGVVRTYENICNELRGRGIEYKILHPDMQRFKTVAMPGYNEIKLVVNPWKIFSHLKHYNQEGYKFHIATEGPLGLFAKFYCNRNSINYTTCFHTLFPEFIHVRYKVPTSFTYWYFRWFHGKSKTVFVPTRDMKKHLENKRFKNVNIFTRGVDSRIFNPNRRSKNDSYIICVSRVSKEKGLDDFCKLKYIRKVLVGDGPYLNELKKKYPDVEMIGKKEGAELAKWIANADVFVFPSKADTFGIVILESISCGTPVAAYEQPGPKEVIVNGINGYYGNDLQMNLVLCLSLNRNEVYESSKNWTWKKATQQFLEGL
jgi:glycosyltransferase involved in cell wall biosynthesis